MSRNGETDCTSLLQRQLHTRIKNACRRHNLTTLRPSRETLERHLLWQQEHNFIFCPNAKTGTTMWMSRIGNLSHLPNDFLHR